MLRSTSMKGRNMDRVRVIRVLEYEGTREWVEACLTQREVKGRKDCAIGCVIREAIVGDFPAVVEEVKVLESSTIPEDIGRFMARFGWEFPEDANTPAIKYEIITGKVLAHEGDETWDRDLKVAGE